MRKVGFIGAYDKTDFMLYIAKILAVIGKRVLLIDSTTNQKAKYIVPVINPTVSYVTEFEGVDVAVGFRDIEGIREYLSISNERELEYDIALIDIDSNEMFHSFEMYTANKNYFVTSFDIYSLRKGLQILSPLKAPINLTKILFAKDILKEDDEYLEYLSLGYKIMWNDYRIYFPLDMEDQCAIMENQKLSKINIKRLSDLYKGSLEYIAEEAMENVGRSDIKRAIKIIEKGV